MGGKQATREKYRSDTFTKLMFAKPKKATDGIYAIVMDSSKFFYDRCYATIDTHCFWCLKAIEGKASEFPRERISKYVPIITNDKFIGSKESEFRYQKEIINIKVSKQNILKKMQKYLAVLPEVKYNDENGITYKQMDDARKIIEETARENDKKSGKVTILSSSCPAYSGATEMCGAYDNYYNHI